MKDHAEDNNKYFLYTREEFLQDDFFISSTITPTAETDEFWRNFECAASYKNLKEYTAAKEYFLALSEELSPLSEKETEELWDSITTKNSYIQKKDNWLYAGKIAAACIGVILLSFIGIKSLIYDKPADIAIFAALQKPLIDDYDDTQLILSKDKTIHLKEQEAEITYDSANIQTSDVHISKKQFTDYNQLIVPHGKRSLLTFSDGTKVWVNSGTRVVYPAEFQKDKREIYVDGEIYLDVAKDENRPFIVKTKEMDVRVLGTRFNVMSYESDDRQSVVLLSGSVQIETEKTPKTVLVPNQMFSSKEQMEAVSQVNVEDYVSWTKGLYHFESEDLGSIFKRLSRYYGVKIICDLETAQLKGSGKLDLKDNLETILQDFSFLAPVRYIKEQEVYRIERKPK